MILPKISNSKMQTGISVLGVCALITIGLAGFRGSSPGLKGRTGDFGYLQEMDGKSDAELEALLDPEVEELALRKAHRALRENNACDDDCADTKHRWLMADRELLSRRRERINARIALRLRLRNQLTQEEKEAAAAARREARIAERQDDEAGFNLLTSEERVEARQSARQAAAREAFLARKAEEARLVAERQAIFDANQEKPCPADYVAGYYTSDPREYVPSNYATSVNPLYYGISHACYVEEVYAERMIINAAMQEVRRSESFGTAHEHFTVETDTDCGPDKNVEESECFAAAFELRGRVHSLLEVKSDGSSYCGCYYDWDGAVTYGAGSVAEGTCKEFDVYYAHRSFVCDL